MIRITITVAKTTFLTHCLTVTLKLSTMAGTKTIFLVTGMIFYNQ